MALSIDLVKILNVFYIVWSHLFEGLYPFIVMSLISLSSLYCGGNCFIVSRIFFLMQILKHSDQHSCDLGKSAMCVWLLAKSEQQQSQQNSVWCLNKFNTQWKHAWVFAKFSLCLPGSFSSWRHLCRELLANQKPWSWIQGCSITGLAPITPLLPWWLTSEGFV